MDISSISKLAGVSQYGNVTSTSTENNTTAFKDVYDAAVNMLKETNGNINAAQEAETAYSQGLLDNPTDLMVAQQKANLSLQYTVAVRNSVMNAYKEIMNLQF